MSSSASLTCQSYKWDCEGYIRKWQDERKLCFHLYLPLLCSQWLKEHAAAGAPVSAFGGGN